MKFGAQLERYAVTEWRDRYIRYNYLKRFLAKRLNEIKKPPDEERPSDGEQGERFAVVDKQFLDLLDLEISKVEQHFAFELSFLADRLSAVKDELRALSEEEAADLQDLGELESKANQNNEEAHDVLLSTKGSVPTPEKDLEKSVIERLGKETRSLGKQEKEKLKLFQQRFKDRKCHKARLSKTVVCLCDCLDQLEGFVQLNLVCLYKILKKRDKLLGLSRLNKDLLDRKRRLQLLTIQQYIKNTLVQLYNATTDDGDEAAADMQHLSLVVKKHFAASQSPVVSPSVSFFLGACSIVLVDLLFVAFTAPSNPDFSLTVVLTVFPVFRLCLMLTLISWGAGVTVGAFEYYGVNYKFILNIDPKCQINSLLLFNLASVLTICWILFFGGFLIDFKFGLFLPTHLAWLYPLLLLMSCVGILSFPSKTFRYRYRRNLLSAVGTVLSSGVCLRRKVTLVENIIGDILTSLVKPLVDLHYTAVYFLGFPFLADKLSFFGFPRVDWLAVPLIAVFPYWIRLMQCFSRYRHEDPSMKHIHAANMGKYASTLVVILTSLIPWEDFGLSIYASRLIFVIVYSFASIYNLIWDVTMDWGLMPDPDNFVRPDLRILYPQWLYYFISFFNLIGRLTWALTLIPISIIDDTRFNASVITLAISSMEILRRSAWLILRLENEHLTNSSRYRAMLWVPRLINTENQVSQDTSGGILYQSLKRFTSVQPAERTIRSRKFSGPGDTNILSDGNEPDFLDSSGRASKDNDSRDGDNNYLQRSALLVTL